MGRWIENQQEYINTLQKDLDKARRAARILKAIWPPAEADNRWEGGQQHFEVYLRGRWGHVWGSNEHEHAAWLAAWDALTAQGVLEAEVIREFIQKMDKENQ
jgi:hypothetical protein